MSALSDGSRRQRVPGHRTGDGERPTAERAATMSWYDEMVAAGRLKSLTKMGGEIARVKGPRAREMGQQAPCPPARGFGERFTLPSGVRGRAGKNLGFVPISF